ncbi:MAG: cell division protein FtsA [Candidatus Spyradocola sp.]
MAAAIEFGTSKIVTLVGEGNGSGPAQLLGFGVVPYDGYSDGHWNASDEEVEQAIMKSVREAELSSGREIKEIYVGVPGDFIHLEQNEVVLDLESERRITPEDVDDVMNLALDYKNQQEGVIIHRSPAWFTVDDRRTMEPAGLKGQVIRCMASFVVADPTFLEDMQARMEQQDIHISGYLSPALGEALLLVPPEERDKVAVLVDIGYLSTEVMFIQGDALMRYKVLPMGGGHLTASLAMELGITMDMAEELKRRYTFGIGQDQLSVKDPDGQTVSFHRENVLAVIEPRVAELSDMVRDAIEEDTSLLSPRSTFYITGGGLILMRGGRETISSVVERTFRAPTPPAVKLNSPAYSSAIGLLELVYESVSQMEIKPAESGGKIGGFFKAFFTK